MHIALKYDSSSNKKNITFDASQHKKIKDKTKKSSLKAYVTTKVVMGRLLS